MSATGFEETDLTYQVSESESMGDTKVRTRMSATMDNLKEKKYSAGETAGMVSQIKHSYYYYFLCKKVLLDVTH